MDRRSEQHENRRLPEVYYQRRRAAAVVALVVVVLLIVWVLSTIGGGDTENTNVAESGASSSATATSSARASETSGRSSEKSTESQKPSAEPTSSVAADAKTTCAVEDLVVSAASDQANYDAKAQPKFFMTVKNPTKADCGINADENPLRFEVYNLATNQRIWSDIDCNQPVAKGKTTFKAGEERYFEAIWSRTGSAPKQCSGRQPVPAGSYYLHTVIGGNPSPAYTFNLQ
ncbi:hypothetical protein [Corynebacterium pseudotuberculosis]|uniref:hypothetical protein n=1 Tax=Corynebacterium pseudotuberculosis TaxID=1719 RepID=UPI0007193A7B|nr:hypothetical protein [Corynebacterium pseudotuberculosis]ALP33560.1 Hypothetical protein CpN1_0864 [Corynebacterium pseudotuberculosis]ALR34347.1 Hypothetical protein CpPA01_1690 [Corynebacterium pseudotuberculosis]APX36696.1 hypothetical protein CpPA05_10010 [Corynebacterium pseudotuberculosis]APX38247.1 hypothetical protein CpPA06_07535 [Corynebacterium pseudotuberculosis]AQL51877.1 hypothetical protein CpPA04_1790 [Corynebacterium pseudotuberculosis]